MGLFDDDDDWGTVVPGSTDYARVALMENHLVIVFPIGYIDHSATRFTQPGKKSDVIVCDVIDLDDVDEQGNAGKVYRTAWWRSAQLIMTLRPLIGRRTLGRIAKGVPRNGMNPPWVINDATTEPGALERARAWGQAHTGFTLSTFTPPPAVSAPPPQQPQYQPQQPPQTPYQDPGFAAPQYQQPQQAPQFQQPQYQQAQYRPPQQPQYQQPQGPPPQQQYPAQQYPQQGPPPQQYPQQGPPTFPVQQSGPNGPDQLDLMRAERMRRESVPQNNGNQWQNEEPPF